MATAKASDPFALISRAVASAASRLRSAMTGVPPSAAKRSAISLPMPLAAPVMTATFLEKRDISALLSGVSQVIEHDLAETQGQVGYIAGGREHLMHRQPRHVAQRMLLSSSSSVVAHQLADPRRAIDMGAGETDILWRASLSSRLRGKSPRALHKSSWKASVSFLGEVSSTHCSGV